MMDAAVPLLEAEGEEAETAMSAELHERTRSVDSTSSSTSSSARPPLSPFMRRCRRIALNGIPSWSRIAKSWYFEGIVCAAVMTDFLCVIIELERPGQPRVEWVVAEFLISVAFVLELVFEVVAFGPKRFWRSWRRRYQALIGVGAPLIELYLMLPTNINNLNAIRYVLLARIVRLFFLLSEAPRFQGVFRTFRKLLAPLTVLSGVVVATLATFSALGIFLFGGHIYEGNAALVKTDFANLGCVPIAS